MDEDDYQLSGIRILDEFGCMINEVTSFEGDDLNVEWLEAVNISPDEVITGVSLEINASVPTRISFTTSARPPSSSFSIFLDQNF